MVLSQLFAFARDHDAGGVASLRDQLSLDVPGDRFALGLALYIASPEDSSQQFIDSVPDDSSIMGYVYGLELQQDANGARLTPYFLYSLDMLGNLACEDQPNAVHKLLLAVGNSDGVVTEFLCDRLADVKAKQPAAFDRELPRLSPEEQSALHTCDTAPDS